MLYRVAMGIEYNGSQYCGWQRQKKTNSVQSYIENALSKVANESIIIFCAGRTDSGVHALGQVIHFDTNANRSESSWIMGTNVNLPNDIAVRWCKIVDKKFHARYSAISRRYYYIILNQCYRSAFFFKNVTHFYCLLNEKLMHEAVQYLIGEHDFSSFRAVGCQSKTSWRNIIHANVNRYGDYILIDIKANSFVYHMMRNIVGCLLEIGCYKKNVNWISKLLNCKDRTKASVTAKPDGLYLVNIEYADEFNIPKN